MWVGFLYMAVVSDVFVVLFSLQTLRDTRTSRKGREKIVFVFHSKLNVRANRIKMRVECRNVFLVENTKRVVNIPQPKVGRSMKRSDSCVFNVFHVKISNDGRNARTHGGTKGLLEKRFFV